MKLQKREVVGRLQLLITTLFWGTSFMFVKIVQEYVPPTVLMAYRFTIATAILVVIYFRRLKQIDWGYLWRGGLIGIFMFGGFVLQTYGLNTTSPGTNAFLTASYCVITPFLFWMINKIRPSIWNFAAAFICLIGIGLVSIQDNLQISAGDLITLAGGVLFAAQIVATSIFTQKRDPILLAIIQIATAALFSWISSLCFETIPTGLSFDIWWKILYLAIFCTAIGFTFQNLGQKVVDPTVTGIIFTLEAVFAVIVSAIFFKEDLTVRMIIGFCVIFVSIFVSETKLSFLYKKRKKSDNNIDTKQ